MEKVIPKNVHFTVISDKNLALRLTTHRTFASRVHVFLMELVSKEVQTSHTVAAIFNSTQQPGRIFGHEQMRTNVRICPDFHTFLCKFFTFLNACISVKTSLINTKLGDFVNLVVLLLTMLINRCLSRKLQTRT